MNLKLHNLKEEDTFYKNDTLSLTLEENDEIIEQLNEYKSTEHKNKIQV
jgi:hypothetical protein